MPRNLISNRGRTELIAGAVRHGCDHGLIDAAAGGRQLPRRRRSAAAVAAQGVINSDHRSTGADRRGPQVQLPPLALFRYDSPMSKLPDTEPAAAAAKAASETIALRLAAATLQAIDDWAARHAVSRTVALGRLIKLGLAAAPSAKPVKAVRTARASELAASQLGRLIDPAAPSEERDRLISRLTKGPPEFVDARLDLPKVK